jgi:hypothetical protein
MSGHRIRGLTVLPILILPAAMAGLVPLRGGPAQGAGPGEGIAARHPGDAGIARDADVVFADDFEAWGRDGTQPPAGTWAVRKHPASQVRIVPGKVTRANLSGPGVHVLEMAYWKRAQGGTSGGLELLLGNYNSPKDGKGEGYDELYVRYYLKLGENYKNVGNHGSNLGGRDPSRKSYWVGQAGVFDVGLVHYFYSGLQPYPNGKAKDPGVREWELGFYSYHLDKPDAFGERLKTQKKVPVRAGEWHCVERHLKLNSVDGDGPAPTLPPRPPAEKPKTAAEKQARYAQARADRDRLNEKARRDGLEELWVDGELTCSQKIRYRRSPRLHINYFKLENWYPNLPPEYTAEHPLTVYYDNVVIARRYIGPIRGAAPRSPQ